MSTISTCERCSTPLTQRQTRFCSQACYRGSLPVYERRCERCPTTLTKRQHWDHIRFCSPRCAQLARPDGPTRRVALDILRGNRHSWLTQSDLAIWIYGDDRHGGIESIRTVIYRLRLDGYRIESRHATWELTPGPACAYRLIEQAQEAAA